MTTACGLGDSPLGQRHLDEVPLDARGSRSVSCSWHVSGGFTCTYSHGRTRTTYWF